MDVTYTPIGTLHSPFRETRGMPSRQSRYAALGDFAKQVVMDSAV